MSENKTFPFKSAFFISTDRRQSLYPGRNHYNVTGVFCKPEAFYLCHVRNTWRCLYLPARLFILLLLPILYVLRINLNQLSVHK